MVRFYSNDRQDERFPVDRGTLSGHALFLGWLGTHKFYGGHDILGAIYFTVTVLGLILTLYEPIWVTVYGYHIQLALVILFAPLVASIIEFLIIRRFSDSELEYYYHQTGESLTLVLVSQFIFLILLLLPIVYRAFS